MMEIIAHLGFEGISAKGRIRGPSAEIAEGDRVTIEHAIELLIRHPTFKSVETPWGGVRLMERNKSGWTYRIVMKDLDCYGETNNPDCRCQPTMDSLDE